MALSGSVKTNSYSGRYYTLSWTATQSVANNQSTISWTLKANGAAGQWLAERTLIVDIAGTKVVNKTDRVQRYDGTVATGSLKLTHDSAGKKNFSVSIKAAVYTSDVNLTGSGNFTLDTIARKATIKSAPNFTDEDSVKITYDNPAGSKVTTLQACISFTGGNDDIAYRDISKTGTEYTFNFTNAEKQALWGRVTSGNSNTVVFYIKTIIGGTTFYSTSKKTLTLVNHTPTLAPTVEDSANVALTGSSSKIISGANTLSYAANAAGRKGATIKSVKLTNGSKNYTTATGTINNTTDNIFTFTATDSRGNTVSKKITLTMIEYIRLTNALDVAMELESSTTSKAVLKITGKYWGGNFGAKSNTLVVKYRYKLSSSSFTSSDWKTTTATINTSKNTYSATVTLTGLDYKKQYKFQASANDELTSKTSSTIVLQTLPVFDWSGTDFAFNVPVTIQDNLLSDYIVERGTEAMGSNGTWQIEKWASGKAVCYGVRNYGNMGVSTAWGNLYESENFRQSFPSGLFIEAPEHLDIHTIYTSASLECRYGHYGKGSSDALSKNDTGLFSFYRVNGGTVTASQVYVQFYVVGKWR